MQCVEVNPSISDYLGTEYIFTGIRENGKHYHKLGCDWDFALKVHIHITFESIFIHSQIEFSDVHDAMISNVN
jgi:hypothetical protein